MEKSGLNGHGEKPDNEDAQFRFSSRNLSK
jgi:hypothetical protein